MNHTFDIKVTVSDAQIEEIMSSALTGMWYWTGDMKLNKRTKPQDEDMYFSQVITRGYNLKIYDNEESKWRVLTLTKFLKGLELSPQFDYDNYDSLDAEQVVQKALFGKVIYG